MKEGMVVPCNDNLRDWRPLLASGHRPVAERPLCSTGGFYRQQHGVHTKYILHFPVPRWPSSVLGIIRSSEILPLTQFSEEMIGWTHASAWNLCSQLSNECVVKVPMFVSFSQIGSVARFITSERLGFHKAHLAGGLDAHGTQIGFSIYVFRFFAYFPCCFLRTCDSILDFFFVNLTIRSRRRHRKGIKQ